MSGAGDFERDGAGPDGGADDLDALAALLPFYLNGRLSPRERARVDAGLARMPELRAELAEVQALSALVKRAGAEWAGDAAAEGRPETRSEARPETRSETEHQARSDASSEPVAASSSVRLQRLMARIAEQDAPGEATSAGVSLQSPPSEPPSQALPFPPAPKRATAQAGNAPQRLPFRQRLFRPPYSMALAAGLAAIAIAQAGWLMRAQSSEDEAYASLSGTGQPPAPAALVFSLRLKPETPWGEVTALLSRQDLRIVAGPRDGLIDVAPNAALTASQADALEEALQASPLVVFVGRGS